MSYSSYLIQNVVFPAINFGTNTASSFRMPKGMRGRIKDILVEGTTLFTAVTTGAAIKIGLAADDDAFATFDNIGALAATDSIAASVADPGAFIDTELPMDTQIEVAFVAPTGGSPAGVGTVTILVNVY